MTEAMRPIRRAPRLRPRAETETTGPTLTFVPEPDQLIINECDPFAQDCPDGEKCVPYGSTGANGNDTDQRDARKCGDAE